MKDVIGERSKVEISFLIVCVTAVVWLLTHILPAEAQLEGIEVRVTTLENKIDEIRENTSYIRGKLENRGHK